MNSFNDAEAARLAKEAFGLNTEETNVAIAAVESVFTDLHNTIHKTPTEKLITMSDSAINDILIDMFTKVTKACTGKLLPFSMFILGARVGVMLASARSQVNVREKTIVFIGDKPMSAERMAELKKKFGFPEAMPTRGSEDDLGGLTI